MRSRINRWLLVIRHPSVPPQRETQGVSIPLDPLKGMSRTPWFAKHTFLVENA